MTTLDSPGGLENLEVVLGRRIWNHNLFVQEDPNVEKVALLLSYDFLHPHIEMTSSKISNISVKIFYTEIGLATHKDP